MKFLATLACVCFCHNMFAAEVQKKFTLQSSDCSTMGAVISNSVVQREPGDNFTFSCESDPKFLTCRDSKKSASSIQHFGILLSEKGVLSFQSTSKNVSFIVDFESKKFISAQYNYVPAVSGLISKSCVGKVIF